MSNQKRVIKEYDIVNSKTGANKLVLTLEYRLGGWNYFTGKDLPRGLFLSCSPLEIKDDGNGFRTVGYVGFSGSNMHVKDMKRFSKKTLDNFEPKPEDIKLLVDAVIKENQLEVEGYDL